MARNDISRFPRVAGAKGHSRAGSGATTSHANVVAKTVVSDMRAQLKTLSAATYTDAYLDKMTKNDMMYALRVGYDSTDIK